MLPIVIPIMVSRIGLNKSKKKFKEKVIKHFS